VLGGDGAACDGFHEAAVRAVPAGDEVCVAHRFFPFSVCLSVFSCLPLFRLRARSRSSLFLLCRLAGARSILDRRCGTMLMYVCMYVCTPKYLYPPLHPPLILLSPNLP
jgi:hypothetical protein